MFRLGRVCPPKGPGIVLVLPLVDQWQKVDLRTRAFNIPPCQVHLTTQMLMYIRPLLCRCLIAMSGRWRCLTIIKPELGDTGRTVQNKLHIFSLSNKIHTFK